MGNPRGPSKNGGGRGGGSGGGGGGRGGGESELHAAARAGDVIAVETICSSNPSAVNSRDRHSRTPLHLAAWSGQKEVVSCLCKHKADVGAAAMDDTGAIHFASQKGHLEVVRVLLSSGVSVRSANRKGFTPLHYAVQGSHLELIKYLIRKGASLSAKTRTGESPIDLARSEEVRAVIMESEKSFKKEGESTKSKDDESIPKQPEEECNKISDATGLSNEAENDGDERQKREAEETAEESLSSSKKARVSLQHLIAEDDTEVAEEE